MRGEPRENVGLCAWARTPAQAEHEATRTRSRYSPREDGGICRDPSRRGQRRGRSAPHTRCPDGGNVIVGRSVIRSALADEQRRSTHRGRFSATRIHKHGFLNPGVQYDFS